MQLILYLLLIASRTRIPYVRDVLVSSHANVLWKVLPDRQSTRSLHPCSLEATYWPTMVKTNQLSTLI